MGNLVVIVDPGISNQDEKYKPYQDGLKMDIFIKVINCVRLLFSKSICNGIGLSRQALCWQSVAWLYNVSRLSESRDYKVLGEAGHLCTTYCR